MFKLSQRILNVLRNNNNNNRPLVKYNNRCPKSTTVAEIPKTQNHFDNDFDEDVEKPKIPRRTTNIKTQNSMVAAAFAALHPSNNIELGIKTPFTDDKISKAKNINDLLSISEGNGVSRRHALKVMSTLAEWSSAGRVKLTDFENDPRFLRLCRILTKGAKINRNLIQNPQNDDLNTVLNVTADDEAARLVASLSLPQAVRVTTTLSQKKRRSVSLLRSLAYNITSNSERLNLKGSADLLFSLCVLNFHDDNLVEKIVTDVSAELMVVENTNQLKTSAVIGSIITSLGLLKYKNSEILDELCEWVLINRAICRQQDVFSLFITLATLNHQPSNCDSFYKVLIPQLSEAETRKPTDWLNVIWALVILNQASIDHVASVLSEDFVNKFETGSTPTKLKLLNINGAAQNLIQNYYGPTLSSNFDNVEIIRTKEKNEMVGVVIDSLKNLIQSEHLKVNVNTNFGFFIDAYCLLDSRCNPVPITEENEARSDVSRVAILVHDYHDMCRGKIPEPTGTNVLAKKLLESQNYRVLSVPYTKFKINDNLVHRVQFLETKLKEIVK